MTREPFLCPVCLYRERLYIVVRAGLIVAAVMVLAFLLTCGSCLDRSQPFEDVSGRESLLPATPEPALSRVGLSIDALFSSERLYQPRFGLGDEHGIDPPAPTFHGEPALFAFGVDAGDLFAGHEPVSIAEVTQ